MKGVRVRPRADRDVDLAIAHLLDVFYLPRASYVDVIRVLHGARDIPAALQRERKAGA